MHVPQSPGQVVQVSSPLQMPSVHTGSSPQVKSPQEHAPAHSPTVAIVPHLEVQPESGKAGFWAVQQEGSMAHRQSLHRSSEQPGPSASSVLQQSESSPEGTVASVG